MRVVGYMTWEYDINNIIVIFLCMHVYMIYIFICQYAIYMYMNMQYIYIHIEPILYGMQLELKWLFGGSLLACNVQGSKDFTNFQPTKTMVIKGFQGPKKKVHRELPHAVDLVLFGTMHRFVSAAHWYTASLKFTNHKSDEYHECHEVMFLHSWHSLSPMKFKRNN